MTDESGSTLSAPRIGRIDSTTTLPAERLHNKLLSAARRGGTDHDQAVTVIRREWATK